jgi:hypothetical protein
MVAPQFANQRTFAASWRRSSKRRDTTKLSVLRILGLTAVSFVATKIPVSFFSFESERGLVELTVNPQLVTELASSIASYESPPVPRETPWTVFYNVYLPRTNLTHALTIVEEQLEQVSSSYGATKPGYAPTPVHFNTIGDPIGAEKVQLYCATKTNLHCVHMQHYEDGNFEDVTLTRLFEFCSNDGMDLPKFHPNDAARDPIVVYLHSKGTYHSNERNDHWRRFMTNAAMGEECLNFKGRHNPRTNADSQINLDSADITQCNVCGFMFYPIWTPFFPGNIWSAKCSYIRKLMHPQVFKNQSDSTANKAVALMREGRFTMNLLSPYFEEGGYLGRERFADEHWVGSHPSLMPCDVAPRPHLMKWIHPKYLNRSRTYLFDTQPLEWSLAPRHPINEDWLFFQGIQKKYKLVADRNWRHREFFLLPGALWKWITWYNAVPPTSSYVWSWFPEGLEWLGRVQTLGTQGLLNFLTQDTFLRPSGYRSNSNPFQIADTDKTGKPVRTFFFHIHIPTEKLGEPNFPRVVHQRLQSIGARSPGATVFFNTVGEMGVRDVAEILFFCRETYQLNCVHMEHLDAGMELVTWGRVHDFCQIHNSSRVGFVHAIGSTADPNQARREQLHLFETEAVASDQCWTKHLGCDTCSFTSTVNTEFENAPKTFNAGDIRVNSSSQRTKNDFDSQQKKLMLTAIPSTWTASCAYILNIGSPSDFAARFSQKHWEVRGTYGGRWIVSNSSGVHCQVKPNVVTKLA